MGYPLSLPEFVGPMSGPLGPLVGRIDTILRSWGLRLRQEAMPLYNYRGSADNPLVSDFAANRWGRFLYDPTAGNIEALIPEPDAAHLGEEIVFTRVSSSTNTLTVRCLTATIRGSTTYASATAWRTLRFIDLGSQWAVETF